MLAMIAMIPVICLAPVGTGSLYSTQGKIPPRERGARSACAPMLYWMRSVLRSKPFPAKGDI